MHFEVYLTVGGENFDADAFAAKASVSSAIVREIGTRGAEAYPNLVTKMCVWESPHVRVSENPESEVVNLLSQHAELSSLLTPKERNATRVWITIVAYHQEGGEPRGFSFRSESVSRLTQLGAGLEIDAVLDLEDAAGD